MDENAQLDGHGWTALVVTVVAVVVVSLVAHEWVQHPVKMTVAGAAAVVLFGIVVWIGRYYPKFGRRL